MRFSKQNIWSDAQAITATALSTNVIDLKHLKNKGRGVPIPILVQVVVAFNTLTSLTVTLETDTTAAFSSGTVIDTSGAIALALLVVGYRFPIFWLPVDGMDEQFAALRYTVTGTDPTLGKITAGIIAEHHQTPASGF